MEKTLSSDIDAFLKSTCDDGSKITAKGSEKKVKSSKRILDLLKEHPEYSAKKIAAEVGISSKAVEKHLAKFKAAGIIIREGPDKGGQWIVKCRDARVYSPDGHDCSWTVMSYTLMCYIRFDNSARKSSSRSICQR